MTETPKWLTTFHKIRNLILDILIASLPLTTTAVDNTEAYSNFYRDIGNAYVVRLKDVISQDEMEERNQHEVIPPIVFIMLFVLLMYLIFR